MKAIEIAQRLAQLNETESALQAYKLALAEEADPTVKMEAAVYILQFGKDNDYKISYTMFHDLYNQGIFKENILEIMDEAFYAPNVKLMKAHYKKNCALLEKYPYIFRKDFLKFENLPIKFYPFDDTSYTPYYPAEERFGAYIDFKDTVIKHYFFKDLEKPVLATDITSQYELEYLRDNVRRSEDVAKENHIYLHYTSWAEFCSYLPCLNMKPLLEEQKIVFLFEDEISQYPIDFKERFNIDYSKFTLQPIRIREVSKMIWHTQLSSHNGGDFFNEIFDSHPNLLAMPSVMMDNTQNNIAEIMEALRIAGSLAEAQRSLPSMEPELVQQLYMNRERNEKDVLVALFLHQKSYYAHSLDTGSRIVPALFFQPHFSNIHYRLNVYEGRNQTTLSSAVYDEVQKSPIFRNFKYIKTFTPMRRFTTSHGSTVKFMNFTARLANENNTKGDDAVTVVTDAVMERVLNRSFMVDPDDRLYHDGVVVRLEDGKINPKATFAALAHFLDLPYTESMTYCSLKGEKDPKLGGDYAAGFSLTSVYRNVDEYMNEREGQFIEYFMRDAYEHYGYDFLYYDGKPVDSAAVSSWISGFDKMNQYIAETWKIIFRKARVSANGMRIGADIEEKVQDEMLRNYMKDVEKHRIDTAEVLLRGLNFINQNGQLLRMMPKLELDPALLEQPLYHGRGKQMEKGTVYFFTGLAGAGKTTIGGMFYEKLKAIKPDAVLKDGDKMREDNRDRDYSTEARRRGAKQTFLMCRKLADQGFDVVYCGIAMYQDVREWNRANIENYREIYVKTSMETLRKRNQKGLYSPGAKQVVGVDLPWDEPVCPDIVIENEGKESPEEIVRRIMAEFDLCSLEGREQA